MKILAIETSCDETAVAVVEGGGSLVNPSFKVLGQALYSQVATHKKYGGVYPSLAKREHGKNLVPILYEALADASLIKESLKKVSPDVEKEVRKILDREGRLADLLIAFAEKHARPDVNVIAVTYGPGLEPTLWVGIQFARALSLIWDISVIPVNHMEGHIYSCFFGKKSPLFPAIALLVSGGHTQLIHIREPGQYALLGETRDDAAGEAFDKIARILGLPYPGGPEISREAEVARQTNDSAGQWKFPRPMIGSGDFDFSFSGLKTAVLYAVRDKTLSPSDIGAVAREAEEAIVEVLVAKAVSAANAFPIKSFILAGGVAANGYLRTQLSKALADIDIPLFLPEQNLYTDNAVMIAAVAFIRNKLGEEGYSWQKEITANSRLALKSL